jgi:hypothetical protein
MQPSSNQQEGTVSVRGSEVFTVSLTPDTQHLTGLSSEPLNMHVRMERRARTEIHIEISDGT